MYPKKFKLGINSFDLTQRKNTSKSPNLHYWVMKGDFWGTTPALLSGASAYGRSSLYLAARKSKNTNIFWTRIYPMQRVAHTYMSCR